MTTTTFRMTDDLRDRAVVFAKSVGISLNALTVVALYDYLGSRTRLERVAPGRADGPKGESPSPTGARVGISYSRGVCPAIPRKALARVGVKRRKKRCLG
jgi:hypothetical protein